MVWSGLRVPLLLVSWVTLTVVVAGVKVATPDWEPLPATSGSISPEPYIPLAEEIPNGLPDWDWTKPVSTLPLPASKNAWLALTR